MTNFSALMDSLRRHEGFRQFAYRDSVGVLTVGYGRNLESVGIDELEAEYLLRNDVIRTLGELNKYPWFQALNDVRQGALVNMAFNIGIGGVLGFKDMIAALGKRDYPAAAAAALDSKWSQQVGNRAVEIAMQIRNGIDLENIVVSA